MQQAEARLDALLHALSTIRCAMEFRDHWKDTMPARIIEIADEAIREENRMRAVDGAK